MKRRSVFAVLAMAVAAGLLAAPASAQQSLNVQVGSFTPRALDARIENDVLFANQDYLTFNLNDFKSATVSADWSVLLGGYFEVGAGVGYYQRNVPSVWTDWVNDDGSDIWTDLKLRIVPVTALVRIFPGGANRAIQPYIGGGLNVYFWRYSETGDFVDFTDNSIFTDRYVGTGTSVGPLGLAGVRARISHNLTVGVEGRIQWGRGMLSTDSFLTDRIDLGGSSVLGTIGYRF
jgi:outer membrane protein W